MLVSLNLHWDRETKYFSKLFFAVLSDFENKLNLIALLYTMYIDIHLQFRVDVLSFCPLL